MLDSGTREPSTAVGPDALVAALFTAEASRLVSLARFFVDDRTAAEDLVQEAFIRLSRSAHRIRDPERAAAYLRSIVINLARDHNRRGLVSLRHRPPAVRDEPSAEETAAVRGRASEVVARCAAAPPTARLPRPALLPRPARRGDRLDPGDLRQLGEDPPATGHACPRRHPGEEAMSDPRGSAARRPGGRGAPQPSRRRPVRAGRRLHRRRPGPTPPPHGGVALWLDATAPRWPPS